MATNKAKKATVSTSNTKKASESTSNSKKAAESTSNTVGRQELIKRIAKQASLTQKQASDVLEATLKSIREALQEGSEVRLVGFGSFKVRRSAARRGVNPRNREAIEVPAKDRVRFTPGKELSDSITKK